MKYTDEQAAFEVRTQDGHVFKVFASGETEGFPADSVVLNRIPRLLSQQTFDTAGLVTNDEVKVKMKYTNEQFIDEEPGLPERSYKVAHGFASRRAESLTVEGFEVAFNATGEQALWGFYKEYGALPTYLQRFDFVKDGNRYIGVLVTDDAP